MSKILGLGGLVVLLTVVVPAILRATGELTIGEGRSPLTAPQVEAGCRLQLPASTQRLDANLTGTLDANRDVRLEFDARDLALFLETGRLSPLQTGVSPGFPHTTFASEPWWTLDRDLVDASSVASTDRDGGWLRAVVIQQPASRVVAGAAR